MWRLLQEREASSSGIGRVRRETRRWRARELELSQGRIVKTPLTVEEGEKRGSRQARLGITALDLDHEEDRYLLAGDYRGNLAVYDMLSHVYDKTDHEGSKGKQPADPHHEHRPLFTIRSHSYAITESADCSVLPGHSATITCAQWYPVDTGMFLTGSTDCTAKLTDANEARVVCTFPHEAEVTCAAMPRACASSALVATASGDECVRVFDPRTGGGVPSQLFSVGAHTSEVKSSCSVRCITWSTACEWHLISGSSDGRVRYWDVRRAGVAKCLDQHSSDTQEPGMPRPSLASLERPRPSAPHATRGDPHRYTRMERDVDNFLSARKLIGKFAPGPGPSSTTGYAHNSAVAALHASRNCLHLYSVGADGEARKWDMLSGRNLLVNFEVAVKSVGGQKRRRGGGSKQVKGYCSSLLATSQEGCEVFMPQGSAVFCVDAMTGRRVSRLGSHYDRVTCCVYNDARSELYTASLDGSVLVWEPGSPPEEDEDDNDGMGQANEDNWSSDEGY